ncbi:MAG: ribose 5-phosphate isomerase B [Bacilli bacterium]|nr:ribose 5-phosphate isomerase B [Bacilli bacterium]
MKLAIATDHNGVNEKKEIISFLVNQGFEVLDLSQDNTSIDDYPDFAKRVCEAVLSNQADLGILMCGTGIGMSIAANKFKGIRCAKVSNESEAILARQHNNANVIALSYKENINNLKIMIEKFVKTDFSNEERHVRRIEKIEMLEQ